MNNLFHAFAEYPVLIAIALFLAISLLLAVLLGVLMRRAGVSLKPLVFFFGFLAVIGVPQILVHVLDAFVHARQTRQQTTEAASATTVAPGALQPVSWDIVFECRSELDHGCQTQPGLHPQRCARSENFV